MNENVIESVRQRLDIVDLAGEQVQLQKSGRNFRANCPFHGEKTPSFYVYPERQTWHCFGACATGGDVFSYVMKRDNADFAEALRTLAERAGVMIERGKRDDAPMRDRLQAANEAAILFFRQALTGSMAGEQARAYVQRRGLDEATLAAFELGYAPDGWDNLRSYLEGRGFSEAEQLEAGLLTAGEQGSPYDRFRRRLIFPIRDDRGRAVGFGGRALDDAKPKYLNTPQTPLFDKSNVLFLLDRAKEAIRTAGEAVVVEGYLDAITAHQFGYTNVVATLGTALTERHVQLLKRLTPRVTLAMDADAAGLEAAARGEEVTRSIVGEEDGRSEAIVSWDGLVRAQARSPVEIKVFTVPSGKDPDEAIREDRAGWPGWVQAAISPFDFRLRLETSRTDLADPRARVELADRMLPLLLQIGDRALQASYVEKLAGLAAVNPTTLASRLDTLIKRKDAGKALPMRERAGQAQVQQAESVRDEKVEAFLLAVLLRHPALRDAGGALEPGLFERSVYRQIFSEWMHAGDGLDETLSDELRPAYIALMAQRLPPYEAPEAEKALIDAVQKLRRRQIEEQKRLVTAELSEIQGGIDQHSAVGLTLALQRNADDTGLDNAAEPMLTLASHMQEDEYLMREMHALEWEKRTHRVPRWAAQEPAAGEPGATA